MGSKVLANRLKVILPNIISEYQSAFVLGRLITDNTLIAFERLHTIRNQKSKKPFFALKIVMMKAHDRVEWSYLHGCVCKIGFDPVRINSVMRCVTCVHYAVHINGELTDLVIPSRGIRQGDPISPYLFLLCTEGLPSMLQQREDWGELYGIYNGRLGPPISHRLFADYGIFFARSDTRSVIALTDTLKIYCEGSRHKINLDKSLIFFDNHYTDEVKLAVKKVLQDLYLGMPTSISRSPTATFIFLLDKIWKCLNDCTDRPLSRAGNETFLQAMIHAIWAFVMSCFQLTLTNCDKMRKVIANRWWGVKGGKKKMHW
jgi:hypothetical protein